MTTLNQIRRAAWPPLDPIGRRLDRPLLKQKHRDEYVCSVWCTEKELRNALAIGGYAVNPAATLKYMAEDGERVYELGSWAYRWPPLGKWQYHVYYFPAEGPGRRYHLHQHHEISWMWDPVMHMTNAKQTEGDPDGVLRDALDNHDVGYEVVETPQYG